MQLRARGNLSPKLKRALQPQPQSGELVASRCWNHHVISIIAIFVLRPPIQRLLCFRAALEPPAGYDDQQQQLYRHYDEPQQRDLMLTEDMLDLIRGMAGQDADNQVTHVCH
jgi:hypothetical protein